MAESMGCFGITVNKPSELAGALDQAFASGQPAVVDVKTHVEGDCAAGVDAFVKVNDAVVRGYYALHYLVLRQLSFLSIRCACAFRVYTLPPLTHDS